MLELHDSVASIGHLNIDTVALHAKASVTCLASASLCQGSTTDGEHVTSSVIEQMHSIVVHFVLQVEHSTALGAEQLPPSIENHLC